ncbi:hypothetical protein PG993_003500 [Apiospora rasikravindrae]|uniref:Arrestin-like N-terminal domain-containing protein n=1 Tax=Apiospora rasikravindrae TaxID=990691 RepID=A0ABR1U222_9PEZI
MPRHALKSQAGMNIDFTDFQSVYAPGDTVRGHVSCGQAYFPQKHGGDAASRPEVRIRLFGRAKTKVVRKGNNTTETYRGRAVLFDQSHVVSQGAVTGPARFPFAVTIPETSQPGFALRGDDWRREKGEGVSQQQQTTTTTGGGGHRQGFYLSSSQDDVTKHDLPSVYYFISKSGWSGSKFEAYIEYVLEASLGYPGSKSITTQFPLFVRKRSTAQPIGGDDYKFGIREATRLLRTEMLLAENAERKMTFRERQRRFWTPSKTPRYAYTAKVVHPTVIQLEHPDPIPFKIYIVPKLQDELTSICPDGDLSRLPPVEFLSIELGLKSNTRIRAPGNFTRYHTEERQHEFPIQFGLSQANHKFKIPLVVRGNIRDERPPDYKTSEISTKLTDEKQIVTKSSEGPTGNTSGQFSIRSVDNNIVRTPSVPMPDYSHFTPSEKGDFFIGAPFDLGAHLGIRLSQTGSSTLGATAERPFGRFLYPSFDTYNISLTYQLEWTIRLACAGESHDVHGRANVQVLPPSEEQEAHKKGLLGCGGMEKNYDDLAMAMGLAESALGLTADVLGAI